MQKTKKLVIISVVVLAALLLAVSIFITNDGVKIETKNTAASTQQKMSSELSISDNGRTASYKGQEGVSALDSLNELTKVKVKDTDFGPFVVGINGVVADESKEFWGFYVNGKMATEGASTYIAKSGDDIEWRLEKLN